MTGRQPTSRWIRGARLGGRRWEAIDAATRGVVRRSMSRPPSCAIPTTSTPPASSTAGPTTQTIREAEAILAMWEGAAAAMLFSSGMAAATSVFMALRARRPRRRADRDVLGAAQLAGRRRAGTGASRSNSSTPATSTRCARAIKPGRTKLVWLETPSNPLWTVSDIAGHRRRSPTRPARRLAVDSTVATPVFTRPLDARRGHRHARRDQGPERPFRRRRRRARHGEGGRGLGAHRLAAARTSARSSARSRPSC